VFGLAAGDPSTTHQTPLLLWVGVFTTALPTISQLCATATQHHLAHRPHHLSSEASLVVIIQLLTAIRSKIYIFSTYLRYIKSQLCMDFFQKANLRQLKCTLQPLHCKTRVSDLHWYMGKLKEENSWLNYWNFGCPP